MTLKQKKKKMVKYDNNNDFLHFYKRKKMTLDII